MPSDPDSLADLHDLLWSEIEGARLLVQREWDDNDPLAPESEYDPDKIHHEEREGRLVGRSEGTGLYYDTRRRESVPTNIGPKLSLSTPGGTVLEVMTDRHGNELLVFNPQEVDDE